MRKLLGMRNPPQIADLCFALSGEGAAVASGFGLPAGKEGKPNGAHWARQDLAVRAVTIGGGTTDIQLNIIAERMPGLPRDPEPPAAEARGRVSHADATQSLWVTLTSWD